MTPQEAFERAQREPSFRQEFISRLGLDDLGGLIRSIEYLDAPNKQSLMVTRFMADKKSEIVIYASAFDDGHLAHVYDFLSGLKDHEFVHVEHHAAGRFQDDLTARGIHTHKGFCDPQLTANITNMLLSAQYEIPAYSHQLVTGAYSARISPSYKTRIEEILGRYTAFTDIVREQTGIVLEDLPRDPGRCQALLCANSGAIYDAVRRNPKLYHNDAR